MLPETQLSVRPLTWDPRMHLEPVNDGWGSVAASARTFVSGVSVVVGASQYDARSVGMDSHPEIHLDDEIIVKGAGADAKNAAESIARIIYSFDFFWQCIVDTPKESARVRVPNRLGIHSRPSGALASCAERYSSLIALRKGGHLANAKSTGGLLMLAVGRNSDVCVQAMGRDAGEASLAIARLITNGFGEE